MDDLINRWIEEIGGQYTEYAQPEGFCKAACQYWISDRMRDRTDHEIVGRFNLAPDRIALRQQHLRSAGDEIPGTRRAAEMTRNYFGFGDLRSRQDLMDRVLGREGYYSFSASTGITRSGPGHAVGFTNEAGTFRFFEPNSGVYEVQGLTQARRDAISRWFHDYWDFAGYKADFHLGARKLVRYSLDDFGELLSLAADPATYMMIAFV